MKLVKRNTGPRRIIMPAANIRETDHEVIVEVEMAGLSRQDISVELAADELTITGRRSEDKPPKGYTAVYRERSPFDYKRSFVLSEEVDKEKISARYENGVLILRIPKSEKVQPKRIEIATG